ncbi:MAG TPA: TIGR01777 family oxidoreductase [Solirubrobacterales bacterium]|nr:TIGR01777 family oxidoreductase [Solirubrobacterales bacterium]
MKVLVTGASGFIGSALCDTLLVRGDTVAGLTRDPRRARQTNPNVAWHAWEPTLERPAPEAFEGVDAVINLLGERIDQRWTDEAKHRIMESRRTGTHNLVGAIAGLQRKPKVLVNQSAIGFYGNRGEAMVDESAPAGEGFDAGVANEWERAAQEVQGSGVRLVIVRTGHVLDPSGGMLQQLLGPFKLGLGGPLAGGRQYMSWIHIDDEVGILLWAAENEKVAGVVNATAPNPVTNRELAKALGRALGRPAVTPVPGFALDLKFGREFGAVLRGGQRVMPRRALDLGYKFRFSDIGEALNDLL